jgi:hypothetical protein
VNRTVGTFAALLFVGAAVSFVLGLLGLAAEQDAHAFYWLLVGALSLKSSADLVRGRAR